MTPPVDRLGYFDNSRYILHNPMHLPSGQIIDEIDLRHVDAPPVVLRAIVIRLLNPATWVDPDEEVS